MFVLIFVMALIALVVGVLVSFAVLCGFSAFCAVASIERNWSDYFNYMLSWLPGLITVLTAVIFFLLYGSVIGFGRNRKPSS